MIRKALLIMLACLLVVLGMAIVAEAATYEVSFTPTLDGWISASGGVYSGYDFTGSELKFYISGSNTERMFVEWNISAIPINANILNVSFEWISNGIDGAGGVAAVYAMDIKPSGQTEDAAGRQIIYDAIDDGLSLTPGGNSMPGGTSGTHYYLNHSAAAATWTWGVTPYSSLEENLTRGWYALGIKRIISARGKIRSSNYTDVEIKPQLWVKYEMTAPVIEETWPADYDTNVNLTPNTCVNVTHPLGSSFNITWSWWDGAEWQPYDFTGGTTYYWKECKIDKDWVDSTIDNYPLWFFNISADFRSKSNGGRLEENGSDIQFWNLGNTSQLAYELEYYDAETGTVGIWVNLSKVYSDKDTLFYIRYGMGGGGYANPTAVWDGFFVGVYHCNNSYQFFDSTAYANHGVRHGSPTNDSGYYADGINFTSGTSDYYQIADAASLDFGAGYFTIERWFTTPPLVETNRYVDGKYDGTGGILSYAAKPSQAYDWRTLIVDGDGDSIILESTDTGGTSIADLGWHQHIYGVNGNTGTQWFDVVGDISSDINLAYGGTGVTTATDWFIGADHNAANFFNYKMDEIRFSKGICRNDSYMNFTYNWTAADLYWAFLGTENTNTTAGGLNGTHCVNFTNATEPCTTYYWWVHIVDEFGNYTDGIFEFTTHCVNPPTNLVCNRWNSTTLNVTFTPDSDAGGESWTEGYYVEGTTPPAWGEGTYFNTTNDWLNITDLEEGTCYAFSMWTNWNESNDWTRSSARATIVCCTTGGNWRFCLRYEERNQQYINLSHFPCSNHVLVIHLVNGSRILYVLNESWYIGNGNSSCLDVALDSEPLFFELWWNQSYTCGNYNSTSYIRTLLPEAATNESGNNTITFYIMTERRIYGDEYYFEANSTFEYDRMGNLMRYTFEFEDRTHLFQISESWDAYATFYFYNTTNKIIVHQQYWDSAKKVYPVLMYEKPYFTGVNCSAVGDEYKNIGLAPNHDNEEEVIIIYEITEEAIGWDEAIDLTYGWSTGASGLWVHYIDNTFNTIWVNVTIYDAEGNYNWSENISANEKLFTWPAAHHNESYNIVVTIKHGNAGYGVFRFPLFVETTALTNAAYIDSIFYNVLGASPLYNVETGETMVWSHVIVLMVGIMLGCLIVYNGILGILAPGIWLVVSSIFISGLPVGWAVVGFLIIALAISYALYGGGK